MCGIFGGLSSYLSLNEVGIIKQLGILSQLRGSDSTGIFTVGRMKDSKLNTSPGVQYYKDSVTSSELFLDPAFEDTLKGHQSLNMLVGHCRAATVGKVTVDNSHPFLHKNIIGVHNGTLGGYYADKAREEERTDSDVLYEHIAELGIEEALKKTDRFSAYTLVYYDMDEETINFIRNDKRPLYMMTGSGDTTIYWASESCMLDFIKKREGAKFGDIISLPTDTLVTYKAGKVKCKTTPMKISYPEPPPSPHYSKRYHKHEISGVTYTYPGGGGRWDSWEEYEKEKDKEEILSETDDYSPLCNDIADASALTQRKFERTEGLYFGFKGKIIPTIVAQANLDKGCSWCSGVSSMTDAVTWFTEKEYICTGCSHDRDAVELCINRSPIYVSRFKPTTVSSSEEIQDAEEIISSNLIPFKGHC